MLPHPNVRYEEFISRETVRSQPINVFVFGDNVQRRGTGGQAGEMRGEPNALGIVTKFDPGRGVYSYLSDAAYEQWYPVFRSDIQALRVVLHCGIEVVFPARGIGTGLADVAGRSPRCWDTMFRELSELGITNPYV